jgi:hypothetical protein
MAKIHAFYSGGNERGWLCGVQDYLQTALYYAMPEKGVSLCSREDPEMKIVTITQCFFVPQGWLDSPLRKEWEIQEDRGRASQLAMAAALIAAEIDRTAKEPERNYHI